MSIDETSFDRALGPLLELAGRSPLMTRADLLSGLVQVLEAAVPVLGVRSVGLILLDEDDRPRVAAATDDGAAALEAAQAAHGEGPGIDAMRSGTTIAVTDVWAPGGYPHLRLALERTQVRGILSSPIRVGSDIVGNLNALDTAHHEWTWEEIRANDAYASVIGLALRVAARVEAASEGGDR